MTETWLALAIRRPGPAWKQGYISAPSRTLEQIEGKVKHSAEGSLAGLFAVLDSTERQASWHFSHAQDGRLYQHYPLEAICWHAGLPGDRRLDTSLIGNATLIGEEHEGGGPGNYGEPLTEAQYQSSLYVSKEVRRLCPHVAASPPTLRRDLWEHGWLSNTSCPSGRIPWTRLIADLEGNDMTEEQWKLLQDTHHHVHVLIPGLLIAHEQSERNRYAQLRRDIAAIKTGGSGASPAQVLAMAKKALRDGGG